MYFVSNGYLHMTLVTKPLLTLNVQSERNHMRHDSHTMEFLCHHSFCTTSTVLKSIHHHGFENMV